MATPSAAEASHARFTHLSIGGGTGTEGRAVGFLGASQDGSRIFFSSWEQLVYQDRDGGWNDVYEHSDAGLRLISTSQYEADGVASSASFGGMSEDGEHVFFSHVAPLAPEDTDTDRDVYERTGDTVRLVSTGQYDNPGAHFAWFEAVSADGVRAIFHTTERLIFADDDAEVDLYARAHGRTELVTYAPGGEQEPRSTAFKGASRDAQVVVFEAAVPPVGDLYESDLYVRTPEDTVALPGGSTNDFYDGPSYRGMSDDGARIFYETSAALVPEDTDTWRDVYEFSDGSPKLASHGPAGGNGRFFPVFKRASADGSRVFFETGEQLVPEDTDASLDVYERLDGETRLVSTGPGGGNGAHDATLREITPDGTIAYFETREQLTPDDQDGTYRDTYARSGGATSLVTTTGKPTYGDASMSWVSPDGQTVIFNLGSTYVRTGDTSHPIVPDMPFTSETLSFKSTSPDAARIVFQTDDRLAASDQDSAADLYELGPGDPTRYARPQGATPLRVPLVPAYKECTAPNTSHAQATSLGTGGCNPPAAESRHLTVGTADFNGKPTRSRGHLSLGVRPGDPATPEDEADVDVGFRLTDVRRSDDLSDYTGELQVRVKLRLTDRSNGPAQEYPGTAQDMDFGFTVPCSPTADDAGATCALTSRLRALRCCMPALEGRRTVMKVGDVRVYDGGPDGKVSTAADADVFAWQGLFIP